MVIWDWVQWFFHIVVQTALYWIPLLEPTVEPLVPPDFFLECGEFYLAWPEFLDENRRPTYSWISAYWDCIWDLLVIRLQDMILELIDKVMHYVIFAVGQLPDPFPTIPEWIGAITGWIGELLPDWATDIADGLWTLWNFLPEPIREGLQTWAEYLAGAPEAIQEWVEGFIAEVLGFVTELWDWYVGLGQALTEWWQWSRGQLDELIGDAYGWIASTLGETWSFLVWFWSNPTEALASWLSPWWGQLITFASDCLDFWYNLWGSYAEDLAAFLVDPLDFLWDQGEAFLNRKLEQS